MKIFKILFLFLPLSLFPCTNFLVTPGASVDGSSFISYSADSHELYGELNYFPAADWPEGSFYEVVEVDTKKYLGRIPQVKHTYAVIGLMNEFQVSIGETTFGGRKECQETEGILDYGNLMILALQRARTAREAILVMGELLEKYGYASEGETFSIADPQEVWIMDLIGKGKGEKGAVWVALRIPDGYVSAHANQARIRQFPLKDPQNCLYAKDVISFARQKGWFSGKDEEFSFVDTYAPPDFEALRFCEARVWSFFRRVAPSQNMDQYLDYVRGNKNAKPLPLWIKPDKKISLQDMFSCMRDHFEGTEFDLSRDIGAGPFHLPYRWRPLTWEIDGKKYFNERSTSTQQTGYSFISQMRKWLPHPIGGVFWFGLDDTNSTVYIPFYAGTREIPRPFAQGTCDFSKFCWDSAFWVFNFVANWAYSRYEDMIKDIKQVQGELEGKFLANQKSIEELALKYYNESPQKAVEYLTNYSRREAEIVFERWKKLGEFLIWKYLDGNVRDTQGKVTHPPYPEDWYRRIIKETGDKFLIKE